jgi:hypothetical protein
MGKARAEPRPSAGVTTKKATNIMKIDVTLKCRQGKYISYAFSNIPKY